MSLYKYSYLGSASIRFSNKLGFIVSAKSNNIKLELENMFPNREYIFENIYSIESRMIGFVFWNLE